MRHILLAGLFAASLGAPSAIAAAQECDMDANFSNPQEADYWRPVNDGVMGGRSSGGPEFKDSMMRFKGVINTNGGGFSSVRTTVAPGDLVTAEGLMMTLKSDGRAYKVTLRTNVTYRGRRVSFQAPIPASGSKDWSDIFVPFSALEASLFGRKIRGGNFDPGAVTELGIIIADGKDGPFQLDVKRIQGCTAP